MKEWMQSECLISSMLVAVIICWRQCCCRALPSGCDNGLPQCKWHWSISPGQSLLLVTKAPTTHADKPTAANLVSYYWTRLKDWVKQCKVAESFTFVHPLAHFKNGRDSGSRTLEGQWPLTTYPLILTCPFWKAKRKGGEAHLQPFLGSKLFVQGRSAPLTERKFLQKHCFFIPKICCWPVQTPCRFPVTNMSVTNYTTGPDQLSTLFPLLHPAALHCFEVGSFSLQNTNIPSHSTAYRSV